jgi:hypothetical protein
MMEKWLLLSQKLLLFAIKQLNYTVHAVILYNFLMVHGRIVNGLVMVHFLLTYQ